MKRGGGSNRARKKLGSRFGVIPLSAEATLVLVFCSFLAACGGTSSAAHVQPSPPNASAIPATFFAMSDTGFTDPPAVSFGMLGHPVALAWQNIEQTKGIYDFTSFFDGYAGIAPLDPDGSNTADLILVLGNTPPWALADTSSCSADTNGVVGCTAPPDNIQDWTNFVTALMAHYNGTAAPHIKYYEIWNEASCTCHYSGTIPQLVAMAAAAYPIIKTDNHSFVLTPSVVGPAHSSADSAPAFLINYLAAGGANAADIAAYHGYVGKDSFSPYPLPTEDCSSITDCFGSILTQINTYRQVLDDNGMQGKPLFNTEGGFYNSSVSDADTAAAWLAQYYALQAGQYQASKAQIVNWWLWGGQIVPGSPEAAPHTPSKVGVAYSQVFSWLVGSVSAPCSNVGNLWSCTITNSAGSPAEIIWDASQTCASGVCTTSNQTVPTSFTQYLDLTGDPPTTITDHSVPVGLKPILLD